MSVGFNTSCAVFKSGSVACWGQGSHGELGVDPATLGTCSGATPCRSAAAEVPGISKATQVSVGKENVCARTSTSEAWCWGSNQVGALGHAAGSGTDQVCAGIACNWVPAVVPGITSPVVEVRDGERNGCARTADSKVFCWGSDGWFNDGQGNTTEADLVGAKAVPGLPMDLNGLSVSENAGHVCASSTGSGVLCWGANLSGELGHAPGAGTPADIAAPATGPGFYANSTPQASTVAFATGVITSQGLTCTLNNARQMQCMGTNANGDLGNGTYDSNTHPTLSTVASLSAVTAMAANTLDGTKGPIGPVCALRETGIALCWGAGAWGQMGNGFYGGIDAGGFTGAVVGCANDVCFPTPLEIPGLSFTKIAAGSGTVLGLATDGHVYAWGDNSYGKCGHDEKSNGDELCNDVSVGDAICAPAPTRVMSLP